MANRKLTSKILQLQNSAAKSSVLASQNQEYGKRNSNLEEEIGSLRTQLKKAEAERNSLERDIANYVTENKGLKNQLSAVKAAHDDNDSTVSRLLQEVRESYSKTKAHQEAEFESTLKGMKEEMKLNERSWMEKYKKLESKQQNVHSERKNLEDQIKALHSEVSSYKNKLETTTSILDSTKQKLFRKDEEMKKINKELKEKDVKLTSAEKSTAVGTIKTQIQIQALEAKIKKVEEEKEQLEKFNHDELQRVQSRLEEREMQLGAQSNMSKRMQGDLKVEVQTLKKELQTESTKNKELNNQIMRMKSKMNSANENLKSSEEEKKVKTNYYEEQIAVLQKEISSKCSKVDDLQKQLMEAHDANGSEMQELSDKVILLKKEKRATQNRIVELTEELERTKLTKSKDIEIADGKYKQEIEKLKREFKEKEKHSAAQSCVTRKVQDDIKRQLEAGKVELESEKLENNDLNKEIKRFDLRLRNIQESVKNSDDDKHLKLKLSEEQVSALQQEISIKNNKLHELQRQLLDAQEMNGNDMEELTEKLATAKREKRIAQNKVSELQEEINNTERQKSKSELNCRTYKEKYDSSTMKLTEAEKKMKIMENEITQLEGDLTAQESDKDATVDQLRKQLDQKERKCLENEKKISELQTDLTTKESNKHEMIGRLRKELEQKEKRCLDSEKKISQLQSELTSRVSDKDTIVVQLRLQLEEKNEKYFEIERKLQDAEKKKDEDVDRLRDDLEQAGEEIEELKEEKCIIEEKFNVLRENCSVIETMEEQLEDYHERCKILQEKNSSLIEQLAVTTRERGVANRKADKYEEEMKETEDKIKQSEQTIEMLKQTCVMMEEQIEDLEKFNNKLLENQQELSDEREKLAKESRAAKKKLVEVEHTVALEKRRGCEREDDKHEEILQWQVKAREEANNVQELQDKVSDLERKYKLLEMHASSLQKKLNSEKDASERLRYDIESTNSRMSSIENIRQQSTSVLRMEIERADSLAHENTTLQNQLETLKMTQSHDAIKLNCTIAQQSKLIDFLQARVEALEPQDSKKKKKKKNDLYQVPLQYRELQDMLEEAKQTNVQLQQKVNGLRTELQESKSHVGRLKHGINGASASSHTLSPGSIAAITAIVRSPNMNTPTQPGSARSKPRMHHNIPHRLAENLCTHATKCHVCLDTLRFGRMTLKCSECQTSCHVKCRNNMTSACGLPGGLVQHYKQGGKMATASPVSCISAGDEQGDVQGWLKVLCGGSSWERKWVQLREGVLVISNTEKQANLSSKKAKVDSKEREVVDLLQQEGYVHTTVPTGELETTAKTDIPYVFKLELGPDTSCWPPRSLYFLVSGFTDKKKWVAALEAVTMRNSTIQDTIADAKIIGNKIVTLQAAEKLEINCSLPISKDKVLFGCDEGLFLLCPSTSTICDRSSMKKISGVQQVLQMNFLKSPNLIIAIEGTKRRVVTFDVNHLIASSAHDSSVKLIAVDDLCGCHLFAVGSVEGSPHLCVASASFIQIHRFNTQLGKFVKRKEIATSEPCTCLQFTMCSIIMGTNKFYEIELKSYKVDEFLDTADTSLTFAEDSFPVSVLQIGQTNGKHEYLLCYHEFGVFADGFGKRTRKDNIVWSRMPLSFAYKDPYLIITHFYSVEILRIAPSYDYNDNLNMQQAYLNIPSPRYLGPAITEGAAYLSGNNCGKVTVFCCKGNMENAVKPIDNKENQNEAFTPKSCLKRRRMHLAASSQESLDEDHRFTKRTQRSPSLDSRTTRLSESTNLESNYSTSCDSLLSCNTSKWTMGSKRSHFPLESTTTPIQRRFRPSLHASCDSLDSLGSTTSDATYMKYSEDDSSSVQSPSSSRMMWKPVSNSGKKSVPEKPARKAKTPGCLNFEPVEI